MAYIMLPSGAARLLILAMILFLIEFSAIGILSSPTEGVWEIEGCSKVFFPLVEIFFIENTADFV